MNPYILLAVVGHMERTRGDAPLPSTTGRIIAPGPVLQNIPLDLGRDETPDYVPHYPTRLPEHPADPPFRRSTTPLQRRCKVCDAIPGTPCDPKRMGKAGTKGALWHRGR